MDFPSFVMPFCRSRRFSYTFTKTNFIFSLPNPIYNALVYIVLTNFYTNLYIVLPSILLCIQNVISSEGHRVNIEHVWNCLWLFIFDLNFFSFSTHINIFIVNLRWITTHIHIHNFQTFPFYSCSPQFLRFLLFFVYPARALNLFTSHFAVDFYLHMQTLLFSLCRVYDSEEHKVRL